MTELIENFTTISPFSWRAILTAVICGTLIGLERQLRGKPVGIRTSSLIVLGTYIFLAVASNIMSDQVHMIRLIGQIITGIGFLGAGVMLAKDGAVVGVTSAATIWMLAAVGILIGAGYLSQAITVSIIVVAILYGVDLLEARLMSLTRGVHRKVKHKLNGNKAEQQPRDEITRA